MVTGSVSLTFSPDGETIAGYVDVSGASGVGTPAATTEYRARIDGVRQDG